MFHIIARDEGLLELMHVSGFLDCGLHPNSKSLSGKKQLDGNSSVILSQSKLNSLTIIDQEKERRTGIEGIHILVLVSIIKQLNI